jgi:hypothetical protein
VDQVPEHPERRPARVRRRADDGDPPRGAKDLAGRLGIEDRHGPAAFLEIEVGDRPGSFGLPATRAFRG